MQAHIIGTENDMQMDGWMDREERAIEEEKNNKKKNGAFEGLSFNHSAHPHCSSSCCWLVIVLVQ